MEANSLPVMLIIQLGSIGRQNTMEAHILPVVLNYSGIYQWKTGSMSPKPVL